MPRTQLSGVIFDLDGVITDTAKAHARSWANMFNAYLKTYSARENKPFIPFDHRDDYLEYVDGKPRYEGVKSFLESRGIHLPFGEPTDPTDRETICGLGNRKNEEFQKVLAEHGPEVYASSLAFVRDLKERGVKVAVASSSRNCALVLRLASIEDLFDARVDGDVSARLALKGKPDPDIFVTAARFMDLEPGACVVVEDAISGVQAGQSGNFGMTLGIARSVEGQLLLRFGADRVVTDLSEITVDEIEDWFAEGVGESGWRLEYNGFDAGDEKLRETLTTVGNGYLGTRGAFPGERAGFNFYPGTYIAGVFNKLATPIHDRDVWNNDFVNCPNWLLLEYRVGNGEFVSPLSMEILSYGHRLDLRRGLNVRTILCKDRLGRVTRIRATQLASMADPHVCALRYDLTPCNFSEKITFRSSLDGNVVNDGVARYRDLAHDHLEFVESGRLHGVRGDGVFLHVRTRTSGYDVVMSARTRLRDDGAPVEAARRVHVDGACIGEEATVCARENHTYTLEKLVTVYTSLDQGAQAPRKASAAHLDRVGSFAPVLSAHVKAWARLWKVADVEVDGDRFIQRVARLHAYHLLCTASPHNARIDAGMPARGLSGEAYRGHIFWDEVYIFPFFDHHFPEITRALLLYRCNRLRAAKEYARANGCKGAMFPWQTADDGGEETQEVHFNPANNTWGPDESRRQRHVSIAVFVNAHSYVQRSGDRRFLFDHGAELMLEIARFWGSIAHLDPKDGRYHIAGVMGPDEFHEKLPNAREHGLRDNAYTNVMVVWLMERALELLETLPPAVAGRLRRKVRFTDAELAKWRDMTTKMNVLLTREHVIHQFDGYMDLEELNWEFYRNRYYSIHRLDRILKAEKDTPDRYKVAKQADVLMLFYLLPPPEVCRLLRQLGYDVGDDWREFLRRNYDYYERRTSHGSTLSKVVHAVVSSYLDAGSTAWDWFMEAMRSDVYDTQGGTTVEGIHTGVMAGTLDVIRRYFAGVDFSEGLLSLNPHLPAHWNRLSLCLQDRRIWYELVFEDGVVHVGVRAKAGQVVPVRVQGRDMDIESGRTRTVRLAPPHGAGAAGAGAVTANPGGGKTTGKGAKKAPEKTSKAAPKKAAKKSGSAKRS
ncbi:MAG: beta-phosphoglucomutase family hydrolase [Desulfovibrionaceae bacterium]|jgi:beta-phosphoglucomutase family hydrolase|nr:beta-phosphoglucomutase family hydrolase [Desulfovibrionaceae bacterium]